MSSIPHEDVVRLETISLKLESLSKEKLASPILSDFKWCTEQLRAAWLKIEKLENTNPGVVQMFLEARRARAHFCAENDIIQQSYDARHKNAIAIPPSEGELLRRLYELEARCLALRDVLPPAEAEKYSITHEICQAIGHFRFKKNIGAPRFVCITCCCVFDADHADTSLNIRGARGTQMPGDVCLPPKASGV